VQHVGWCNGKVTLGALSFALCAKGGRIETSQHDQAETNSLHSENTVSEFATSQANAASRVLKTGMSRREKLFSSS
jgi:hypothetical protein